VAVLLARAEQAAAAVQEAKVVQALSSFAMPIAMQAPHLQLVRLHLLTQAAIKFIRLLAVGV
jgi:hypothetical protein